jgi:hypothetical protein
MLARLIVRTLAHEFVIACPDRESAAAMAFVRAAPEMPGRSLRVVPIEVRPRGAFYTAHIAGGAPIEGSAGHLVHQLHRHFFATLTQEAAGAPILHAASVVIDGARIVLAAPKASGKSTLAVRLLAAGFAVEGDEHLAVLGQSVMARPRTLRIKPGTLELVPSLREVILSSPFITDWDGRPIYSVEPHLPGRAWRIEEGTVHAIVFLDDNHGGRSVLTPIGRNEAFRRILATSYLPEAGKALSAARLRVLVLGTSCYRLSLGDLDNAVWHLRRIRYPS